MKKYFWNILISIDQFFNVLLSPIFNLFTIDNNFGAPDETISSVMGKNIRENRCKFCHIICYFLNKIDENHCKKSIEEDESV